MSDDYEGLPPREYLKGKSWEVRTRVGLEARRTTRSFEAVISTNLAKQSTEDLVTRFTELALGQYRALLNDEFGKYNRLFRQMASVAEELKGRSGDQRSALMPLYNHANPQVRLMAANKTLALAPAAARRVLEAIAAPQDGPVSLSAGMTLINLDSGVFKPK